eukprot:Blabericola_migrator_1__12874@NODE_83_length_14926_cov_238_210041_g74_i0_p5_GENE_NODE_83_length_14926_cov_238_210041_g74_i0NODE_83_length_14926_cov_238_210041_g74_i0_p5_ORF_typecomplete_len347_score61_552OGFeII_Oxy_2/PF13532_6/1_4e29_NODE_83_length_14926_cov_238_210041_g74_i068987938
MHDAFKRVDSEIRTQGLVKLLKQKILAPLNLVPLDLLKSTTWRQDIEGLFTDYKGEVDVPDDLIPYLEDANNTVAIPVTDLDDVGCPDWLLDAKVFELKGHPGVYVLPGLFDDDFLLDIGAKCVTTYPFLPATNTNLGMLDAAKEDMDDLLHGKRRLRWISLGCDYDWTDRVYRSRARLPEELASKGKAIARRLRLASDYDPDCALVNYYGWSDRLRGHTDDVEEALDMPLITITLGQPGIFLMGGHTRAQAPDALILRHGDCCIMSKESRKDYHGIASLLFYRQKKPVWFPQHTQRFTDTCDVLNTQRINISIRQCWKCGDRGDVGGSGGCLDVISESESETETS